MKRLLIVFFLVPLCSFAQDFRQIADSIRLRRRIPALTYAIFTSDSILEIGAVGFKVLRTKDTVSLYNRYHLGPATISLTAFIAAELVQRGLISWNTSLFKLFPKLKSKAPAGFKDITLWALLSQKSGLASHNDFHDLFTSPANPGTISEKRALAAEWLLFGRNKPVDSSAISPFLFSNANGELAGIMLEKASGKPWEELVSEYINKPLGISVKFGFPNKLDKNQPWGHWSNEGGFFHPLPPDHWFTVNPVYAPAADANMNILDFVKFMQEQLKGRKGEKALLPQRTYEVLQDGLAFYKPVNNPTLDKYDLMEVDGSAGSFYCHAEIIPNKNIAIIVMANSGERTAKGGVLNMASAMREAYIK